MKKLFGPDWLNGYAMAWTFGLFLAIGYILLRACGKVRIEGRERAVRVLREGGVIIAANHPEGLTPFLMSAIFYRHYLVNPRFFVWNMPRERLVPTALLRRRLRCIQVDRDSTVKKVRAAAAAARVLKAGGNILIFAEGTRTFDDDNPEVVFVEMNGRRMRPVKETGLPLLASLGGALVLPVWIDVPGVERKLHFWGSISHLFAKRGRRMTVHFGQEPYRIEKPFSLDAENEKLQEKILSA